jgi:UDP-N-acetylmuramyl pentapeptide synthase
LKAAFNSTADEIARACGGAVIAGDGATVISLVSSDSRETGDGCLFVPLKGERCDGHDFIPELVSRRAVSAVLSERDDFAEAAREKDVALIRCGNTLAALGALASFHRSSLDTDVIAVTGTNGKTTTKELLHAVLSSRYRTHKNEKNYNNEIGVPFSVLALNDSHEKAVFELGMNHPGEIERLSRIVKPRISVITSVGEGHLEFLGSVRNVAMAKME